MSARHTNTALAERQEAERAFHDHKFATGDSLPKHYRANPTAPVFGRMLEMLGRDLTGLRVLEYGCGEGWVTCELAARGARVSAFDISPVAVEQTRTLLARRGLLDRCSVEVMAGERLLFEDSAFDAVVGFAILHHLELKSALNELRRVLAPGGKAYFAEPLGSNPLINAYRRLTPQYRTADEKPINLEELAGEAALFSRLEHHDQLMLAAGALALCYVPGMTRAASAAQRLLMRIDDAVLHVAPWTGKWAWYSILVLQK
jgi:SAM-dependent methyltransferase